jgi:hypothetical protein
VPTSIKGGTRGQFSLMDRAKALRAATGPVPEGVNFESFLARQYEQPGGLGLHNYLTPSALKDPVGYWKKQLPTSRKQAGNLAMAVPVEGIAVRAGVKVGSIAYRAIRTARSLESERKQIENASRKLLAQPNPPPNQVRALAAKHARWSAGMDALKRDIAPGARRRPGHVPSDFDLNPETKQFDYTLHEKPLRATVPYQAGPYGHNPRSKLEEKNPGALFGQWIKDEFRNSMKNPQKLPQGVYSQNIQEGPRAPGHIPADWYLTTGGQFNRVNEPPPGYISSESGVTTPLRGQHRPTYTNEYAANAAGRDRYRGEAALRGYMSGERRFDPGEFPQSANIAGRGKDIARGKRDTAPIGFGIGGAMLAGILATKNMQTNHMRNQMLLLHQRFPYLSHDALYQMLTQNAEPARIGAR